MLHDHTTERLCTPLTQCCANQLGQPNAQLAQRLSQQLSHVAAVTFAENVHNIL